MRETTPLLFLAVATACLSPGCGRDGAESDRRVSVRNHYFPPCRARLAKDGEVLATFEEGGEVAVSGRAEGGWTAEFLGPDGWTSAPVRIEPYGDDLHIEIGELFGQSRIDLYFDNRDGADAEVSIGRLVLSIPAGTTGAPDFGAWIPIPPPATEEGTVVRIDGREAGRVAGAARVAADERAHFSYLIDLSGRRRYRKTLWNYGEISAPSHRYEEPLGPAHVVLLDEFVASIDFLHPSPASGRTISSRIEILDWDE